MSDNTQYRRRGGPGRGQGRKPVREGEQTISITLRMTKVQREKLGRLGGAEWVRARIDEASELPEDEPEGRS